MQDDFCGNMWWISCLHDWAVLVVLGVVSLVWYLACFILWTRMCFGKFSENEGLELLWTFVPIAVLFLLSVVSLRTLYVLEEVGNSDVVVKVVGHQWYWSYECSALCVDEFSSYLVDSQDVGSMGYRLLEVDSPLVLPVGLDVRLLVTSDDVVHSWAVPSLGVKVDGVPGRLNQLGVNISRSGIVYGQCSEICGAYHSFMPINVECLYV